MKNTLVLCLMVCIALLSLSSLVYADVILITEDTVLEYDLIDCPGTCIIVAADNVTLDCDGHRVDGILVPDPFQFRGVYGIFIDGFDQVTITGCRITEYVHGIYAREASGLMLVNNTLYYNHETSYFPDDTYQGITFIGVIESAINANVFEENQNGLLMENSSSNAISNNTFLSNTNHGIFMRGSSAGNLLWENTFLTNTWSHAYEDNPGVHNEWNTSDAGNSWDNFLSNPGYPYSYDIPGPGDGVDWHPAGGAMPGTYHVTDCSANYGGLYFPFAPCNASWELDADITCSGTKNPLCPSNFTGNFSGNNHTITGLTIQCSSDYCGLFARGGEPRPFFQDITLENIQVTNSAGHTGSIIGGFCAGLQNVHANGSVSGNGDYTAGLVADSCGDVLYSSFEGTVNGNLHYRVAGLVAMWQGMTPSFYRSYFKGNILGCYASCAGLAGHSGLINQSFAIGWIERGGWAGGLAGYPAGGIYDSYFRGTIGIIGGGEGVGGLIGMGTRIISNSYFIGSVQARRLVGGLAGEMFLSPREIQNSFVVGSVNGISQIGALTSDGPTVTNSFWNNNTNMPPNCHGGGNDGCTAIDDNETYFRDWRNPPMTSWDFENVWGIDSEGYFCLLWQEGCEHVPACTDADGDGFSIEGGECGPIDNCPAAANPDQLDQDQDGLGNVCDVCPADAGNDADHDLYCSGALYHGPSIGGNDCNDADASIHPDAPEVCSDGVDQDCSAGGQSVGDSACQTLYAPHLYLYELEQYRPMPYSSILNEADLKGPWHTYCASYIRIPYPCQGHFCCKLRIFGRCVIPWICFNVCYTNICVPSITNRFDEKPVAESSLNGRNHDYYLDIQGADGGSISFHAPDPARFNGYGNNVYVREVEAGGYIVLQYWFMYPYSTARRHDMSVKSTHEGDLEMIQVMLNRYTKQPVKATYSYHTDGATYLWDQVPKEGTHPKVYVAYGGHGSYATTGTHDWYFNLRDFTSDTRPGMPLRPWTDYTMTSISEGTGWVHFGGYWGDKAWPIPFRAHTGPDSPANTKYGDAPNRWYNPIGWANNPSPSFGSLLLYETLGKQSGEGKQNESNISSLVNVHVYDSQGNHIGLNESGEIEAEIEGTYLFIEDDPESNGVMILTDEDLFFDLQSTGEGAITVEIQSYDRTTSEQTDAVYGTLQLVNTTRAFVNLTEENDEFVMEVDTDGDGMIDAAMLPENLTIDIIPTGNETEDNISEEPPAYLDGDGDGIYDSVDNCPYLANPDQLDLDRDGIGDGCDADSDNDLVNDTEDNCPFMNNTGQSDTDWDGIGDVCDACPADSTNDFDVDTYCSGAEFNPPSVGGNDCDDNHSMVYPGNDEVCDCVDNDCNGFTDEGVCSLNLTIEGVENGGTYSRCIDYPLLNASGEGYAILNASVTFLKDGQPWTPGENDTQVCDAGRYSFLYTVRLCSGQEIHAGVNFTISYDQDADGVLDEDDLCPGTHLPDDVPTQGDPYEELRPFKYADIDGERIFETNHGSMHTPEIVDSRFSLNSTYGCNCYQILFCKPGRNMGELLHGCSAGTMLVFTRRWGWFGECFAGGGLIEGDAAPLNVDTDRDGTLDSLDSDDDNDGILDEEEIDIGNQEDDNQEDGTPDWYQRPIGYSSPIFRKSSIPTQAIGQ